MWTPVIEGRGLTRTRFLFPLSDFKFVIRTPGHRAELRGRSRTKRTIIHPDSRVHTRRCSQGRVPYDGLHEDVHVLRLGLVLVTVVFTV